MRSASSWVVLKFGGTSVSSLENWRNIASIVRARHAAGARVLIVHSALSGVTDALEELLDPQHLNEYDTRIAAIEERHRRLASELGVATGEVLARHGAELRQILSTLGDKGLNDLAR